MNGAKIVYSNETLVPEITERDKCCICGKVLFINGKRQTNCSYWFGAMKKYVQKNGWYGDGSMGDVLLCKDCYKEENKYKVMDALWERTYKNRIPTKTLDIGVDRFQKHRYNK